MIITHGIYKTQTVKILFIALVYTTFSLPAYFFSNNNQLLKRLTSCEVFGLGHKIWKYGIILNLRLHLSLSNMNSDTTNDKD